MRSNDTVVIAGGGLKHRISNNKNINNGRSKDPDASSKTCPASCPADPDTCHPLEAGKTSALWIMTITLILLTVVFWCGMEYEHHFNVVPMLRQAVMPPTATPHDNDKDVHTSNTIKKSKEEKESSSSSSSSEDEVEVAEGSSSSSSSSSSSDDHHHKKQNHHDDHHKKKNHHEESSSSSSSSSSDDDHHHKKKNHHEESPSSSSSSPSDHKKSHHDDSKLQSHLYKNYHKDEEPYTNGLYYGYRMNHAIYRFPASLLGERYMKTTQLFNEWIGSHEEEATKKGAAFAQQRTSNPEVSKYHHECYDYPDDARMLALEELKKKKFRKPKRGMPKEDFLQREQEFFYNITKDMPQDELVHITEDSKWAWRTTAVYSLTWAGRQSEFRDQVYDLLHPDEYIPGSSAGAFWYPPGGSREWHTNAFDLHLKHGVPKKPWRMYYVTQRPADGYTGSLEDKSGFHIVDGNGIEPEHLESLGAYRLTNHDKDSGKPNVWRVPDKEGYVTLFRLENVEPYRWHCIVADDTVHRYSMGTTLRNSDVENLLQHIGVEL